MVSALGLGILEMVSELVEESAGLTGRGKTFQEGRTACAKAQRLECTSSLFTAGMVDCPAWMEPTRGGEGNWI